MKDVVYSPHKTVKSACLRLRGWRRWYERWVAIEANQPWIRLARHVLILTTLSKCTEVSATCIFNQKRLRSFDSSFHARRVASIFPDLSRKEQSDSARRVDSSHPPPPRNFFHLARNTSMRRKNCREFHPENIRATKNPKTYEFSV